MKKHLGAVAGCMLAGLLVPGGRAEVPLLPIDIPLASEQTLDPEGATLLQAQQRLALGQRLEALTLLRGVLKRQPQHRQARFMVATTLVEMGKSREALVVLRQLVESNPRDMGSLNNLAWLLATAQDPAVHNPTQALALVRQALLIAPTTYNIWSTLAECYYQTGDYEKALRAAEEALSLSRMQGVPETTINTYTEQVKKCRDAVQAFSLIE